ncbi:MAG: hypothetical protein HZA35_00750 [Parcubacteria group bacterium]|nr:hypothetical protein [Parcubacteria group bacterium]
MRTVDLKKNVVPKPPHHPAVPHHAQKKSHFILDELPPKKQEEGIPEIIEVANVVPPSATLMAGWPAQAFLEYEHPPRWYWGIGGGATLFALFALFTKDYLFFIFILIALFYIFTSIRKPATPFILEIYDHGIKAIEKWHPFSDYKDFSVIDLGNECIELTVHPKKKFQLPIDLYLLTEHAPEIKEVLGTFIPEIERQESFVHLLGRVLRF